MDYIAPRPNLDIKDRKTYELTRRAGHCAKCGDTLIPFSAAPFVVDHGDGDRYTVTDKCGLCKKCFEAFRNKPVRQYKADPYKITALYREQGPGGRMKDYEIIEYDGFAKVW
jgi:hypothetical protein